MQINAKWAVITGAVLLGLGSAWLAAQQNAARDRVVLAMGHDGWRFIEGGQRVASLDQPVAAGEGRLRNAAQLRSSLLAHGSLAGTMPSGDWCVQGGVLRPCPGLRGRFEYYLMGLGEAAVEEIRLLIEDEARRQHGDKLAADIMAVFDRYWKLRTYPWRKQFMQGDLSTWMPVLEEQRSVRREILGRDWAEAFFGEDERHFLAYQEQLASGQPPLPDPGEPVRQMASGQGADALRAMHAERVAKYGEAAAARLDEVDAKWADWERRLAKARAAWEDVQAANHLSEPQKKDEMDRYVGEHFVRKEQIRVRALLRLP